jgi:hypothetical protein
VDILKGDVDASAIADRLGRVDAKALRGSKLGKLRAVADIDWSKGYTKEDLSKQMQETGFFSEKQALQIVNARQGDKSSDGFRQDVLKKGIENASAGTNNSDIVSDLKGMLLSLTNALNALASAVPKK